MAKEAQDFFKWEEDTFIIEVIIQDADTDLSGYEAYWAMALSPTHSAVLVKTTPGDFSAEGGITWSTTDRVQITISGTNTDGLTAAEYYHELTIKDSISGDSVVVSVGTFDLRKPLFPTGYR